MRNLQNFIDKVKLVDPMTPKSPGHLRFVCVSDTHGLTRKMTSLIPDGDVLLHAGDFSNTGEPAIVSAFNDWLASISISCKIVIAGNHDLTFDPQSYPQTYKRFG